MTGALLCIAALGLLVFGLGLRVSFTRQATKIGIGYPADDPTHPLTKIVRAHGNAAEYVPLFAVLMLAIASRGASHIRCASPALWSRTSAGCCWSSRSFSSLDPSSGLRGTGTGSGIRVVILRGLVPASGG